MTLKYKLNNSLRNVSKRKRMINFVVDLIVIGVLVEITVYIEGLVEFKELIKILRALVLIGAYYIPMKFFLGRSIGKYPTRSRVVKLDDTPITLRDAVVRNLCRWIPFDFLSGALGADAKIWHDVISNTRVVPDTREHDESILDRGL